MDLGDLSFIAGLASERLDQLQGSLPKRAHGFGSRLISELGALVTQLRDDIQSSLDTAAETDDEGDLRVHQTDLLSSKFYVDKLHGLTPYIQSIGREDIPLGIIQLAQVLIEDMVGADKLECVIHPDDKWMYSMIRVRRVVPIPEQPDDVAEPIIVRVPGLDAANALLSPILAHEIAHVAVDRRSLVLKVIDAIPDADFELLAEEHPLALQPGNQREAVKRDTELTSWTEELLCDALATCLAGPSMLFATAVFLPATGRGSYGKHPFPVDRVQLIHDHLDELGWGDLLQNDFQAISQWVRGLEEGTPPNVARLAYLRAAVQRFAPRIRKVAEDAISDQKLTPNFFENVRSMAEPLLEAGIPPLLTTDGGDSVWSIILLGWIIGLRGADTPGGLRAASADGLLSAFLAYTISRTRIAGEWHRNHVAG